MVIIFHLFDRSTLRFSELERAIPGVSQKMLIQQLRELERDGIVVRKIYPQHWRATQHVANNHAGHRPRCCVAQVDHLGPMSP